MYSIIFLLIIIIALLLTLIKVFHIKKNYFISILITLFIILFILNLETSFDSVVNGCKLCFFSILPALFPFSVICNLLICYDGISLYSKIAGPLLCKPLGLSKNSSFAIVASFICGYPLGAKYTSDLYELGYIERDEFIRLANIATNCSPLFILGTIATSMFGNIKYGYLLLVANYISVIVIGMLTRKKTSYCCNSDNLLSSKTNNFGDNLKNSINNAISTVFSVFGFIIVFSIILGIIKNNANISIILNHLPTSISAIILGSLEITNGCNILKTATIDINIKLSLISFLCSFSGICIIFQSFSFLSKYNISILRFSILKFIQGILSLIITYCISSLFNFTTEAFSIIRINNYNPNIKLVAILTIILLAPYVIFKIHKKILLHIS